MTKMAVIGLGYVGLPLLATIEASNKYTAVGYDINAEKISQLSDGICPIKDDYTHQLMAKNRIQTSADPMILQDSDVIFICVPTPVKDDFSPDLSPLLGAIDLLAKYLKPGLLVVIESTVNPGVCDEILIERLEQKSGCTINKDFALAHCPERINPGDTDWNISNIPRNIGASSSAACKKAADIYRSFLQADVREMATIREAEATKIIENTFRDINIAYVNELAKSFDVMKIDLVTVLQGAASKPFGFMPHFPGCGVGGHCIPVDPYYLINRAMKSGFDHKFLRLAREINNSMPAYTVELVAESLNQIKKAVRGCRIGVLGLAYKGNVRDDRESPAHKIIALLRNKGAIVETFDPHFPEKSSCPSLEDILQKSAVIIIATAHAEFCDLPLQTFLRYNVEIIIDGKNVLDKEAFDGEKIIYRGIGRG